MARLAQRGYVAAMGCGGINRGACGRRSFGSGWPCLGLFTLLAASLSACGPGSTDVRRRDPRPNVVIVSMDTTRADHLSVYGYERDTSPSLRALADQGIRFELAYSPSATTGPSHASLFTSLAPIAHGVAKNGWRLDDEFETMAEALASEGYETAAIISSYVLSERFGFAQGFAYFDADFSQADVLAGARLWEGENIEGKFYGRADDTTRRALQWLDARQSPELPFFLFVHYFDPHNPYIPPSDFSPPFLPGPREALKLNRTIFFYDTILAFTDEQIGRLLAGLAHRGLEGDTLVVVVGDHGEGLMEHGHMFHGVHIYEEGVRVPLILRWPGQISPGVVSPGPVMLTDISPTVLGLVGATAREGAQGQSIASILRGSGEVEAERPIHLYRRPYEGGEVVEGVYAEGQKFGLRRGRWKLIEGAEEGTLELFDLEADPGERINLAEQEPEVLARLRGEIQAWRRAHTRSVDAVLPSAEDRARLEALGYSE